MSAEEDVRVTVEAFRSGWVKLDAERVLSTIAHQPDIVVYGTDVPEKWYGFEDLVQPFKAQINAFEAPVYTWGQDEPHVWVRGDVAWACGELTVSLISLGRPHEFIMRSTFVLERLDAGWQIVHGHFSVGLEQSAAPYSEAAS